MTSSRRYFPDLTPEDLARTTSKGEQLLHNRIRWARQRLIDRGCLAKQKGIWAITPLGIQWMTKNWKGSGADYSKVVKPQVAKARVAKPSGAKNVPPPKNPQPVPTEPTGPTLGELETPTPAPATVFVLTDPTDQLRAQLRTAQRQSSAEIDERLVTY